MAQEHAIVLTCCDPRLHRGIHDIEAHIQMPAFELRKPGPDHFLLFGSESARKSFREDCEDLIELAEIAMIVDVSHGDCKKHPVSDGVHREHTRQTVEIIHGWNLVPEVRGLFQFNAADTGWPIEDIICLSRPRVYAVA